MLKRAALWLREHRESRVLIVGSCDSSGSETCTHALAAGRGAAIQRFLQNSGIASDQLVGVKGWDNLDRTCGPADVKCQQSNRSVRIFMASSVTPGEIRDAWFDYTSFSDDVLALIAIPVRENLQILNY